MSNKTYDYRSRKFWLTVYGVLLTPFLLVKGFITAEHFVTVFPLVLGLYYTGNVAQKNMEIKGGIYSESNGKGTTGSDE